MNKRTLTMEEINLARDRHAVYGTASMKELEQVKSGKYQGRWYRELVLCITDTPDDSDDMPYGVNGYVRVTFWGEKNPLAEWIAAFLEQQRLWQQPGVAQRDLKPPHGWMRIQGLKEERWGENNENSRLKAVASVDFSDWYGLPRDFLSGPVTPTESELKAEKRQEEKTAVVVPAATNDEEYNPF